MMPVCLVYLCQDTLCQPALHYTQETSATDGHFLLGDNVHYMLLLPMQTSQPQATPGNATAGARKGVASTRDGGAPGQALGADAPRAIRADWEPFQESSWVGQLLREGTQQPDQAAADAAHAAAVQGAPIRAWRAV